MKKMKSILMTAAFATLIILGSCNGNQKNMQNDQNHEQHEEMGAKKESPAQEPPHSMNRQNKTGSYSVGDHVPTKQVCMVNDAYMAKDQIPVPVNGKTYYGCCKMCVKTLNEQQSARTGIDPITGEKVDKTEAYIVLLDQEGTVGYFKSKSNYETYSSKGN